MPIDRNNAQYITGAIYKPTQTSAPGVWDLDDQANNVSKNLWPLPPQAIQRSLRFNSVDSAYLNRTPVASNRTTWTWSGWLKVSSFGTYRAIFARGDSYIYFNANNKIEINLRNAATNYFLITTPVYRDPSAWYHIVVTLDTNNGVAADRLKLYINNVRVEQYDMSTYQSISAGYEPLINSAAIHYVGGPDYFNGYMAEVNFVDGQALTPSSFGETDQQTGVWIPKRYTGTYGTNGFRLSFANNSSTTTLGYDSSGQGNNWTTNNFSVTPGAGNDVFVDVPSMYNTDTGLGGEVLGNYCTWNPLYANTTGVATLSNGNLDFNCPNTFTGTGTMAVTTGKWYWEITPTTNALLIGIKQAGITDRYGNTIYYGGASITGGGIYVNGNPGANFSNWTVGDVIGVAPDMDGGLVYFYKNGVLQGSVSLSSASITTAIPAVGAGAGLSFAGSANFGQRPFAYPAPTGYKALCTTNLPAPAIGQTSSNQADNHFNVVTYTGNGSNRTITGVRFQPDLIWIKNRSQGASSTQYAHNLYDTVRGINSGGSPILQTNLTDAEITYSGYGVSAVNADGFSLIGNGSLSNFTGDNYVAWCWNAGGVSVTNNAGTNNASVTSTYRANKTAGFSIVSWTYNGAATIAHGLNAVPKFMIIRGKNAVYNWDVYHASIGPTVRLVLNSTSGSQTYSGPFNNTTPTSSVFSQGAAWYNNGDSLIGYIFAEIPGYSAFGSYTGNGSADGPFIYTGFKPALILGKRTDTSSTQGWFIFDTARNIANQVDLYLSPSSANTEGTFTLGDMLSNGFKIRNTIVDWNSSGLPYIYAAFAETPARLSSAR